MSIATRLLDNNYFPRHYDTIPFGAMLHEIFFKPQDHSKDYPLHGPNVIRLVEALFECRFDTEGLICGPMGRAKNLYLRYHNDVITSMGVDTTDSHQEDQRRKALDLLKVAALYHDIGKFIRKANHPQIGANLLRHFDQEESRKLEEFLVYPNDADRHAGSTRFSLICSIIQHHDKFGVVNTGEGALPIFSDILYFASHKESLRGILRNVTAVMLLNLADIAAVCVADDDVKEKSLILANQLGSLREKPGNKPETPELGEAELLKQLTDQCVQSGVCLGLHYGKFQKVLEDWDILRTSIEHEDVQGDRVRLKRRLMELEQNPSRSIQRILRLLEVCTEFIKADCLLNNLSPALVESELVGTLGSYRFLTFCRQLATVSKLDYGLNFFKSIVIACVRKAIYDGYSISRHDVDDSKWNKLHADEVTQLEALSPKQKSALANKITSLFVRVLESLVSRYESVLDHTSPNPRRFGFQMRNLTEDKQIRNTIIELLCIEEFMDQVTLNWIADEVTIWSLD